MLALLPMAAVAQAPTKVARIGYLVLSPLVSPPSAERQAFFDGLKELGYVEGNNLDVEYRSAQGDPDMFPFFAEDLVERKLDVIVAVGSLPASAVAKVTTEIPIVMLFAPDPVQLGLVRSLSRPGGNITGLSLVAPELGAKRLQLLKEALPRVSRIAVIWNSENPANWPELEAMQQTARVLNMTLRFIDVKEDPNLATAFEVLEREPPDALLTLVDVGLSALRNEISRFALARRIPSMAGWRGYVDAGGLMSYAPNFVELSRRAASYVDKIFKGAKPGDLPIEQPNEFELIVNLRTAKALGITIPHELLLRADEVIR
jgi:putative ABC transport system substrate-binding protein